MALLIAAAASVPPPIEPPSDTIVVTGVRREELRAAEATCAKQRCGIRDDVIAAVRYAEALFMDGRYDEARRILGRSVARNQRRAAQDPRAMSELYVAQATVARHYGDPARESIAIQGSVRILTETAADDADIRAGLGATLGLGDYFIRRGDTRYAESRYDTVARQAVVSGELVLAKSVELRRAWLLHLRGHSQQANALLAELAALPGKDMRGVRLGSKVLRYRIARSARNTAAMARELVAIADEHPSPPILMWEPALPSPTGAENLGRFVPVADYSTSMTLRWADVEFQIEPNGTVERAEVTRGAGNHDWAMPIVEAIKQRLYTPIALIANGPIPVRTERYSLTATIEKGNGSNIPVRVRNPRYERLDISFPPPQLHPATAVAPAS